MRRLAILAILIAALVGLEGVLSHALQARWNENYPTAKEQWDLIGVVSLCLLSGAAALVFKTEKISLRVRANFGLVYLVILAFLVSFTDHADYFWEGGHGLHGEPGFVVLILATPVIVPMSPLRAFVLSTIMGATGPLAIFSLTLALGYEAPAARVYWSVFPGIAIILATILAKIVHGMGLDLKNAQSVGAYALKERIGLGGMGEVYLAEHQMLRRPTAVKLLPASPEEVLARFEREVQQTAKLTHPNTVTIFDYGRTQDGIFYYAMELIEGFTLQTIVDLTGPMPAQRVASILRQTAEALQEAHAAGLIHRDVKPSNIMLCTRGGRRDTVKLVDFGLVKELEPKSTVQQTAANIILGTPLYMAPEAILDAEQVDERSDIYALGAVAYFLLCARTVFSGQTPVEVCGHHLHTKPSSPSEGLDKPIPTPMEQLVLRCLEKEPARRPQTASDLLQRLQGWDGSAGWSQSLAEQWWSDNGEVLEKARKLSSMAMSEPTLLAKRS